MATKSLRKDQQRSIDRLYEFAVWCKANGYVKTIYEFERNCGIANHYLQNTLQSPRGSVGAEILCSIYKFFPFVNLTWVIAGEGEMLNMANSHRLQLCADIASLENRKTDLKTEIEKMELELGRYRTILEIIKNLQVALKGTRYDTKMTRQTKKALKTTLKTNECINKDMDVYKYST